MLDSAADRDFEEDGLAGSRGFFLNLLNEVGDDFCVGFGDESVPLVSKLMLEHKVIFNDAVMDHDDAAGAVTMRVGIFLRGSAVGSPPRMTDTEGAFKRLVTQHFFQVGELSGGSTNFEFGTGRATDGDARRIVTAIFEAPESLDDDRDYLLVADVSNDAAHKAILSDIL